MIFSLSICKKHLRQISLMFYLFLHIPVLIHFSHSSHIFTYYLIQFFSGIPFILTTHTCSINLSGKILILRTFFLLQCKILPNKRGHLRFPLWDNKISEAMRVIYMLPSVWSLSPQFIMHSNITKTFLK